MKIISGKKTVCCTVIYCVLLLIPLIGAFMQRSDNTHVSFGTRNIALFGNSLKLGLSVTALALIMGFFCAIIVCSSKILTGLKRYYFVLLMPVPFYIYALSWMYLIRLLSNIWQGAAKYYVSGLGACIFTESLAYFPVAALFILIGIQNIDAKLLRMASVYGNDNKTVRFRQWGY